MATTLEAIQAKMKKLQARADALMTKETAKVSDKNSSSTRRGVSAT
ncbi:hypothetical protein PQR75_05160 [Paraburkholderia fungorum]